MNNPMFTKGPWFTDPDADLMVSEPSVYCEPPEPLFDSQNITIATVTAYHALISNDEAKANAALIAVSPEMYDFIHFFETFSGQAYLRILPDAAGRKIYEDAVRLCKKARGEL